MGFNVYDAQLEEVIAFVGGARFKEQLLAAKAEYFASTGEIFEDDRSFEMRMAGFIDFFIFDFLLLEGKTPAQLFLEEFTTRVSNVSRISDEEWEVFRGFTRTLHSLYEVQKITVPTIRLRDCFTDQDINVFERRKAVGLRKGDLIEARLVPIKGNYMFSPAFCYHPPEAKKNIIREIMLIKEQAGCFSYKTQRAFIWLLSNMHLKYERYRNVAVKDVYSFNSSGKKAT